MSELQKPLEKTDVHLVSFTVDPKKDTPEVLRKYADKLGAQPGRWDFLTGPESAIYDLSKNGFKLAAADANNETGVPVHSTRLVLVDRHGEIRGYYDGIAADAVTKLLADTNHLLREQPRYKQPLFSGLNRMNGNAALRACVLECGSVLPLWEDNTCCLVVAPALPLQGKAVDTTALQEAFTSF